MGMSEKDGKTEKPTPKRLRDMRKKGELAKSQELSSSLTFTVFALLGTSLLTTFLQQALPLLKGMLRLEWETLDVTQLEGNLSKLGTQAILMFFMMAGPALALAFLSGIVVNLIQIGLFFSAEPLKFKFERLNPVSGLKNIFSKRALFGLGKNLAKLGLIAWTVYTSAEAAFSHALLSGRIGVEKIFQLVMETVQGASTRLALVLIILGLADFAYQKYDYLNKLKMTKQEIKEEYKENEGDPQVKSQRKRKYRQLMQTNLKEVDRATLVVTNPTHFAIAIRYERGKDPVPIVVAKGADKMAQLIRERAKEAEVPVMENKPVARALYKSVEVGQSIPPDMYQAIAEMLALVYQLVELKKKKI